MDVRKILEEATKREASDIFIIAGRPLTYKSKGALSMISVWNQKIPFSL